MITIVVATTSAADILIARGVRQIGDIGTLDLIVLFHRAKRVFRNANFLFGLLLLALGFFAFMAVLSWADLSLVVPATSISYAISTAGAKLILNEKVSRLRWAGTLLVCLGVALVSLP